MSTIFTAPVYRLEELNHLFIELTAKNCNHRCESCYINFGTNSLTNNKKIKDFISIDRVKEALHDTKKDNIHCIYLIGAEPMTHPDFNAILRLCLKRSNVCIYTNGSFLNEKKIRFLSKVEAEGENQLFFNLSLVHYLEKENDNAKYRGNFRQTFFALKTLSRYCFSTILTIQNYYCLDPVHIEKTFHDLLKEQEIYNVDLRVINSHSKSIEVNIINKSEKTDCMFGRVLGQNGVYACPFLSSDYRGRVGTTLKNHAKTMSAESDFCITCSQNNNFLFSIN